ncbi:MAG TPA: hypothetical protein VFD58_24930 [Blastocatellia bacterium]|nr:hypothetical protein [Blastocatellia bacterium]
MKKSHLYKATGAVVALMMAAFFLINCQEPHGRPAKEVMLLQSLDSMRRAIDNYTVDKQRAPQSLQELVKAGYLKTIPIDPIIKSAETWITEMEDEPFSPKAPAGIRNVLSGAKGKDSVGKAYSEY